MPGPPTLLERLADAIGVLHPVVVHFAVALLVVPACFELFRRRRGDDRPSATALALLALGTGSAVLAVIGGWAAAETSGHADRSIDLHRWLGLATAIAGAVTLLLGYLARLSPWWPGVAAYRGLVVATALLVCVAGHFGGAMVHGPDLMERSWAALRGQSSAGDAVVISPSPSATTSPSLSFATHVRPILARRCYSCHVGEDAASGLDLDDHAAMLRGGDSGMAAVVPGDPAGSRLLTVVDGSDGELRMPPKGAPLSAEEVAAIRAWIEGGAPHEEVAATHWAYRAPVRPNPPPVRDTAWPRGPLDHFVLARLEQEGLAPSPEADRATLLRRASLDLTGLPPAPEAVDAFLADPRPDAYERAVEELLASPHYGEHWARMWLDLGRYADTHGYEKDDRRTMWPWRDWLIEALNEDLPYDRFSIDMLAGDLLPQRTLEQVVATGFNRNTQINEEGGTDPEEFRSDAVVDRVNTFASVWLGSTIACAQCHDHKYDPFSQAEYFSLYAIFNQDDPDVVAGLTETRAAGGSAPWAPAQRRGELAALWSRREALRRELEEGSDLGKRQADWEREARAAMAAGPAVRWRPLVPVAVRGPERVEFIVASEAGSDLGVVSLAGANPERATYVVELEPGTTPVAALRLDVLVPPAPYAQSVGRGGNIVLTGLGLERLGREGAHATPVPVAWAAADHEQPRGIDGPWPIAHALDDDPRTGWALGGRTDRSHSAWLALGEPMLLLEGERLRVTLAQEWGGHHTIGRFRLLASDTPPAPGSAPHPPEVEDALATAPEHATAADRAALDRHFRDIDGDAARLRMAIRAADASIRDVATATAMVMRSNPVPRSTHVHLRGNFRTPGPLVQPQVPDALRRGDDPIDSRLALAQWLFDPRHPLTARVHVNRLWERLFGRGLVATSDDFGTQGDAPSHPELLDWLATELPRVGWSQKALLREMVTSATYRQASMVTDEHLARDPENRLLSRMSRVRLDAESVRDVALATSGLLAPTIGGPSVFPPQPPGVWTMIYSSDQWKESEGPDRYRRGLYTFWRRTAPYPTFTAFDAPSREIACTRRARTSTPLQALVTLNDPQFVEAALGLARRMRAEGGPSVAGSVRRGFLLVTGRRPEPGEVDRLVDLFEEERAALAIEPALASARLAPFGGCRADENAVDLAALAVVAGVLLNLDETLTRG